MSITKFLLAITKCARSAWPGPGETLGTGCVKTDEEGAALGGYTGHYSSDSDWTRRRVEHAFLHGYRAAKHSRSGSAT